MSIDYAYFLFKNNPKYCLINTANTLKLDEIQSLLNLGVDINQQNDKGETALMHCVSRKDYLAFFIERGANLTLKDDHGWTALFHLLGGNSEYSKNGLRWISTKSYTEKINDFNKNIMMIIQQFIDVGCHINDTVKTSVKNHSSILDFIIPIEQMIYDKFNVKSFDLLSYIVNNTVFNCKNSDILLQYTEYFIEDFKDNHKNNQNSDFYFDIILYLLEKTNIDINKQNNDNDTFLHMIFNNNDLKKADLNNIFKLIKGKFDTTICNNDNKTAVELMLNFGYSPTFITSILY